MVLGSAHAADTFQVAKHLTMLTARQLQVATLACDGLSNKEIAAKLGITEGTIKTHLHAIYGKLNVRSRADLTVRFAVPRRTTAQTIRPPAVSAA